MPEVTAGHTFFLEEWELQPGDLISYYVVARDNRTGSGEEAVSDIYFIDVRPFRRDYSQAEQRPQAGGQQGGARGQGGMGGSLSELQREVVAATFNLLRDREGYTTEEFSENTVSVALAQGRVREEVSGLLEQMNSRGISQSDPHFQEIAELLPGAIEDMESAEGLLREQEPEDALAPEQQALRVLLKAEETYERQVAQQQGGGGGGGGGGGANADELADLFELELDKLQNQYETVQRGERQQADDQVDELMERLKELARRQQQEIERQRRRAEAQQGTGGGSGGDTQRALAEEAEETARQLQELSRRTGDERLAETARRLQEAAEAMRRSASGSGRSQGVADAASALDDLDQAQRRLERTREDRAQEEILDALDRVNRLAESQEEVRQGVERLSDAPGEREAGIRRLHERKDEMLRETYELERDLVQMQQSVFGENPEASEELGDAAEAISEAKLKEKLAYSKGIVEQRDRETALRWEEEIAGDIENLRREVAEAARVFEGGVPDREMEEALDETRDLVRGTESLGRRLQARGEAEGSQEQQEGAGESRGDQPGQGDEQGQSGGQGNDQAQGAGEQRGQSGEGGEQTGEGRGQAGEQGGQSDQGREGGGQGQAQGEGQEGGGRGGEATEGTRADATQRDPGPMGGATRGDPRPFTEEEIRQFTREFAQRLAQARDLRGALEEAGRDVGDLDDAIRAMEALREEEAYGDLPQIALLQEQLRESLKRLEFVLRREVEGEDQGRAALSGTDDVPEGFRRLVEEYFRSLARRSGGGGT
jgi:hypothetical protein